MEGDKVSGRPAGLRERREGTAVGPSRLAPVPLRRARSLRGGGGGGSRDPPLLVEAVPRPARPWG